MAEISDTPAVQEFVERNYKFNFVVNALDGAFYWFGISFFSPSIILPLYISHFTANPLVIGLIPFLATAGFLLPQMFTSNFVERAPLKKWFPVNLGFFLERVPFLLFPLSAWLFAVNQPMMALLTFFLLYAWYTVGAGFIIVGWQDMIAKIIPSDQRGRFFGITNFVGTASGILGTLAVPLVLSRFEFPLGYVIAFSAAGVLIFLSWYFLSLAREPRVTSSKPHVSQLDYLRSLPDVLRQDRNFTRYLLAQIIFSLSGMASGFLVVYAAKTWSLSDAQAGGFAVAMQVGQAVFNLIFGFFSDRKGHKLTIEVCILITVVSLGMAVLAPNAQWFYLLFFLRGAVMSGLFISGVSIVLEFTEADHRPTYIGLANTVPGVAGAIAPLLGGWMAGWAGYPPMFVLSLVIGALSLVLMHFAVRDPRHIAK